MDLDGNEQGHTNPIDMGVAATSYFSLTATRCPYKKTKQDDDFLSTVVSDPLFFFSVFLFCFISFLSVVLFFYFKNTKITYFKK